MANDRLYIRCRCGAVRLLAKYWGYEFGVWDIKAPDDITHSLEDFLAFHTASCGDGDRIAATFGFVDEGDSFTDAHRRSPYYSEPTLPDRLFKEQEGRGRAKT